MKAPQSLPLRILYAIGRGIAHLFRLRWYGGMPGVAEQCRDCRGVGMVDLPTGLPADAMTNGNAMPCRGCAGLGYIYRTDGVT